MELYHLYKVQLRILLRRKRNLDGNEMDRFRHSIYYNPNWVMLSPGMRQPNDKIHIQIFPFPRRNANVLGQTSRSLMLNLQLLAIGTFSNESSNTLPNPIPQYISHKSRYILVDPKVNGISRTMGFWEDLLSQVATLGTHKRPWYLNTPSPLKRKLLRTF